MTCWRSSTGCMQLNPYAHLILTVSPVPLVATATDQHVVAATTYSKAALRVAAEQVVAARPNVVYFPAYEIVAGPQAPHDYYAEDRREVTPEGVSAVMNSLIYSSAPNPDVMAAAAAAPAEQPGQPATVASELSRQIAEAECDEVMADR